MEAVDRPELLPLWAGQSLGSFRNRRGRAFSGAQRAGKASEWKEHERKIDTSEIAIEMPASEQVVLPVLTRLNHGNINDAIARFAEEFTFKDRGSGLEFKDKGRLTEFFQKTRDRLQSMGPCELHRR
jgi:hypothetical protein